MTIIQSDIDHNINTREQLIKALPYYERYINLIYKTIPDVYCELILSPRDKKPEGIRFINKGVRCDFKFANDYDRFPLFVQYLGGKSVQKDVSNCEEVLSILGYKVKNDKNVNSMLNIMDKMM